MSARAKKNPLKMPNIRLHAIPTSHNYRSGFLLLGESIYERLAHMWFVTVGFGKCFIFGDDSGIPDISRGKGK